MYSTYFIHFNEIDYNFFALLNCGCFQIVDLGYHDTSFIKYLKEVPEIKHILGVDTESVPLRCSSDLIAYGDYIPKRESPLRITVRNLIKLLSQFITF